MMDNFEYKLSEIAETIQTGPFGSQLHQSDYSEIGTPVIMPKDLVDGSISESSIARVSQEHVDRLSRHKVAPGDILYSRRGDVGRCAIATEREKGWLCGTGCLRVTIDSQKANPMYVFYLLQLPKTVAWVENHAVGSTMLNLNTSILGNIPLRLPEKNTQDKIVSILSAYDNLIATNQKQISLLEEAALRLYNEWFIAKSMTNYPVQQIDEGWREMSINDVCIRINAGGTPSRSKSSYWENANVNWYKTGELYDRWLLDSEEKISNEGILGSSAKFFPAYTILMAIYASPTLGRLGVLSSGSSCNQAALGLQANETLVTWQWLFYKLLELRGHFNAIAKGAGQQNISADIVKKTRILVPPKGYIDAFTDFVGPVFDSILSLQKMNLLLTEQKRRLLPVLLTESPIF